MIYPLIGYSVIMVYCGGNDTTRIMQYNPVTGEWSKLPSPHVHGFAMTLFNDQLVLAGDIYQYHSV